MLTCTECGNDFPKPPRGRPPKRCPECRGRPADLAQARAARDEQAASLVAGSTTPGEGVTVCPACGVERWTGVGPCSTCGYLPGGEQPDVDGDEGSHGPVRRAVERALVHVRRTYGLDALGEAHAAIAGALATKLDLATDLDDGAGMAMAPVAKELRDTIAALTPVEDGDDDEFDRLVADLSTPVGNPASA